MPANGRWDLIRRLKVKCYSFQGILLLQLCINTPKFTAKQLRLIGVPQNKSECQRFCNSRVESSRLSVVLSKD